MSINLKKSATVIASVLLTASVALGCNVPVFRYALERWPADLYELVVLHDGELDSKQVELVESLRQQSRSQGGLGNFNLRTIEVAKIQDQLLADLWKQHHKNGQPLVTLLYPRNAQSVPDRVVSVSALSESQIKHVTESPVRTKLVEELLNGESAVWLFIPSGNDQQDAAALKRLADQVARNEQELELPPQDEIEADEFFRIENPIELRLGFSVVTVDRDDPREESLLAMLLGSEADLKSLQQPMAFPVIGRGRVLYALVGKGIYPETIKSACRFVVGPCSCQVKEQNPGFDLLLSVAWDEKLGGSVLSDPPAAQSSQPKLLAIPPGK